VQLLAGQIDVAAGAEDADRTAGAGGADRGHRRGGWGVFRQPVGAWSDGGRGRSRCPRGGTLTYGRPRPTPVPRQGRPARSCSTRRTSSHKRRPPLACSRNTTCSTPTPGGPAGFASTTVPLSNGKRRPSPTDVQGVGGGARPSVSVYLFNQRPDRRTHQFAGGKPHAGPIRVGNGRRGRS